MTCDISPAENIWRESRHMVRRRASYKEVNNYRSDLAKNELLSTMDGVIWTIQLHLPLIFTASWHHAIFKCASE